MSDPITNLIDWWLLNRDGDPFVVLGVLSALTSLSVAVWLILWSTERNPIDE